MISLILAGGDGKRVEEVTKHMYPKPFVPLADGTTLLQKAIERACKAAYFQSRIIISVRDNCLREAQRIYDRGSYSPVEYLVEPVGRGTLPTIALAAMHVKLQYGQRELMTVFPADHTFSRADAFNDILQSTLEKANGPAFTGHIALLGVNPERASTRYGYIQAGEGYSVKAFLEKPVSEEKAEYFCRNGNCYWNTGIMRFCVGTFLEQLKICNPRLIARLEDIMRMMKCTNKYEHILPEEWAALPRLSVDEGLLERIPDTLALVRLPDSAGWKDVGTPEEMCKLLPPEKPTEGTVENILIPRRTVSRRWGRYVVLEEGERYRVKRLWIHKNGRLSMQLHYRRAEVWTVVSGKGKVFQEGRWQLAEPGRVFIIPAKSLHCVSNVSTCPLEIIEVSTGDYLGEDDILRLEGDFDGDA